MPENKKACPSCERVLKIDGTYCPYCRAELVTLETARPAPDFEESLIERAAERARQLIQGGKDGSREDQSGDASGGAGAGGGAEDSGGTAGEPLGKKRGRFLS
jgi:glutaredoxin